MKINVVLTLIILVLSSLLGYGVYSIAKSDIHATMAGVVSAICFFLPLIMGLCISYRTSVAIVNIRITSFTLFLIMLVLHFYYANTGISMPCYVLTNGIIVCIYLAIIHVILKSKQ